MTRFAFAIDNRKCIGCHACTVACKSEHGVPIGVNRTWVKYIEKGAFPDTRRSFSVQRCNHCENAPCVEICPVTSLYTRPDGIVDFDIERCIGCKACMQACPYDALYIDPNTDTVGKCNYCTHRVDQGIEPACVVVCPVEAIGSGDLDDPNSPVSILDMAQRVQYPKPEKGTKPKLFYVGGEEAAMTPTEAPPRTDYLWSGSSAGVTPGALRAADAEAAEQARARRVYDVGPKNTQWGWMVSAYVTTKAIAAGTVAVSFAAFALSLTSVLLSDMAMMTALAFLGLTGVLLVADLKQPTRFLYVLLRPQWKSWLVRGAYFILALSALIPLMWLMSWWDPQEGFGRALVWAVGGLGALGGLLTAVYTAFLFAQAKGRDLWQSPLLPVTMLLDALLAGTAALAVIGDVPESAARPWLIGGLILHTLLLAAEFMTPHASRNAEVAAKMVTRGVYQMPFLVLVIGVGIVAPLTWLFMGSGVTIAAVMVVVGLAVRAHLTVQAPQRIPLS